MKHPAIRTLLCALVAATLVLPASARPHHGRGPWRGPAPIHGPAFPGPHRGPMPHHHHHHHHGSSFAAGLIGTGLGLVVGAALASPPPPPPPTVTTTYVQPPVVVAPPAPVAQPVAVAQPVTVAQPVYVAPTVTTVTTRPVYRTVSVSPGSTVVVGY